MQQIPHPAPPPALFKILAHETRWQVLTLLADSDYRVQELAELTGSALNQISYHLAHLREAQLVNERRSSADGRDVYYSLNLDALRQHYLEAGALLHPALVMAATPTNIPVVPAGAQPLRVIFVCTHNSARSQMAEALTRFLGGSLVEVYSAGSQPTAVHPLAIATMKRSGIDISDHKSESVQTYIGQPFDYVVTVCDSAREECPVFPYGRHQIHWSFADPSALPTERERRSAFEQTALQLKTRIEFLLIRMKREAGIPV